MMARRLLVLATLLQCSIADRQAARSFRPALVVRPDVAAPDVAAPRRPDVAALVALRGGGTAPSAAAAAPLASAMALHGLCLGAAGYYAQDTLGLGAAALLVASAGLSISGNFPAYMTGVHVALLLQAGSAGVFGVQAARAGLASLQGAKMCGVAGKLLPYAVASVSSVAALGAMSKLKPKKAKSGKAAK